MSQLLAASYDSVPYPGLAVARSQPDFLACVARVRAMQPTAPAQARVVEIGCGLGQNLLPLAERYPEATFLGIDVSGRQVDAARAAASELKLANIEFRQQDYLDFATTEKFDYVIAQSIYSWVDEVHREALLPLIRDLLAPQGVGYVSYKAYPGWRIQDMFRDLMRYDARMATTPAEVMSRARMSLDFMHKCFTSNNDYDQFAQAHLAPLLQLNDAFLWHDFLTPISHPVLFQEFMQSLGNGGLQLLGDAQFGIRPADVLDPESERQLASLTADPIQQEQFRDVVRNRALRQALVVHADISLAPTIPSERLAGLRLLGALKPESPVNLASGELSHFITGSGNRVGTPLPLAKAALLHLGSIWPVSISMEELLVAASDRLRQARLPAPSESDLHRLADNMVQCVAGQVVQLQFGADDFVTTLSEKPVASPLVRWQAARSEFATNRRHESIRFDLFSRFLLSLLDGTRDRAALLEATVQAVSDGRLVVLDERTQQPLADSRQRLETVLPQTLERFTLLGVLIA